jgi:hypothetical protein
MFLMLKILHFTYLVMKSYVKIIKNMIVIEQIK